MSSADSEQFAQHLSRNVSLTYWFSHSTSELIIFSRRDRALYVLTGASVIVWLALEQGFTREELTVELNPHHDMTLQKEIDRLTTLITMGCMAGSAADDDDDDPSITTVPPFAQNAGNYRWHRMLDSAFTVEGETDGVAAVFSGLPEVASANLRRDKRYHITLTPSGAGGYSLLINDALYRSHLNPSLLVPTLVAIMRQLAKQDSTFQCAMHAAVLACGGVGMAFPAVSGSGKSTLAAALVANGFTYLGDELALLDARMNVLGLPLPIGVKSGSYQVLAGLYPELDGIDEHQRANGIRCKYLAVPANDCFLQDSLKLSLIIAPQYRVGAEPLAEQITVSSCLTAIFSAGFHARDVLSLSDVSDLIAYLATIRRYKITYGCAADSTRLVEHILTA